jgi:type IV pilus assembly protein PilO
MELPKVNLDEFRVIPLPQKVVLLVLLVVAIGAGFYYLVFADKDQAIVVLDDEIGKLEKEIDAATLKVKHLDTLAAANKQLEQELLKKKARLPQEEEAGVLLKQVSDLAVKSGLDIKRWRPGAQVMHSSKLYMSLPVSVEVAGGYHTAALFFDKISKLERIMNVSNLRLGSARIEGDRAVIQTVFELTAFLAPPEAKPVAPGAK